MARRTYFSLDVDTSTTQPESPTFEEVVRLDGEIMDHSPKGRPEGRVVELSDSDPEAIDLPRSEYIPSPDL